MKKLLLFTIFFVITLGFSVSAQDTALEQYGRSLNLGAGVGGYTGKFGTMMHPLPAFQINYEMQVANSFTLAPMVSFYTCTDRYMSGTIEEPNRYSTYHTTVVPIGLKGTYYLDNLLNAGKDWDFYLAGSLGMLLVDSKLVDGVADIPNNNNNNGTVTFDLHIGTEYHINKTFGIFLDLSTGISTVGVAIH